MDFSKIYLLTLVDGSELLIPSKSKYFVKTEPLWKTNVVSEYAKLLIGDARILPDLPFGSTAAVDS